MHVPTADELAAIAVAYLAVTHSEETPAPTETRRWRLAGRLDSADLDRMRGAVPSGSRWRLADRLDD
ncbi:MAG TPA: hypothetical protein VK669_07895 [Candidatus Limnocylindrales bacterium]|nr:hypothetical protein [Candidatus Limnocylindrales bacterium]